MEDGRIKLFVSVQLLRFRRHHSALFENGEYIGLSVHGNYSEQLLAFARKDQDDFAIILVPRLSMRLLNPESGMVDSRQWDDTWLELPSAAPLNYQELYGRSLVQAIPFNEHPQLRVRDILALFQLAVYRPCR